MKIDLNDLEEIFNNPEREKQMIEDFTSELKESRIKEEILDFFIKKVKRETSEDNLVKAWKKYKEINNV